jgi:protein-L-isoaspartate(D-aspartate) O-methyltransferase
MLEPDHGRQRERMVSAQVAGRGISDPRLLAAMRDVPREAFVEKGYEEFAYDDSPLPIGEGQTISQPYIVALMLEAADLGPESRVLDVGTGSGYAAAIASRLAAHVYSIDRHPQLAETAAERFRALGYDNIEVRTGDGTVGWRDAAPFDAIIVAAGGPEVPQPLKAQLAIGGRLVIPVGETHVQQRLIKVTRRGDNDFEEEDLGGVHFVPFVGEYGWQAEEIRPVRHTRHERIARRSIPPARRVSLAHLIHDAAEPFRDIEAESFAAAFDRYADAKVVLLGEATHGTSEFYRARAAITRRLIEKHGFNIVAVEADWPDASAIDRYVRHQPKGHLPEAPFQRFPTWMWRNQEVDEFTRWLRRHNEKCPAEARTGFYGLDIYNLNASMRAVIDYLQRVDPEAANIARERYGCLTRWQHDPATYGRAAIKSGFAACEEGVLAMLRDLLHKKLDYLHADGESFLDASANARLIASAERYYRLMYYGGADSWNLRDTHMFETLEQVLNARGPNAKAVVWAHNSHIGNAAATEMGLVHGEHNIGQLARERFGASAALIGFGTDRGTVAAAPDWDAPMQIMRVRPAHRDSIERYCRDSRVSAFTLDLREEARHDDLRYALLEPRLERAIGVVYRPDTERLSHYFDAALAHQFDGYVWFEETKAVTPLASPQRSGEDETYPFGL